MLAEERAEGKATEEATLPEKSEAEADKSEAAAPGTPEAQAETRDVWDKELGCWRLVPKGEEVARLLCRVRLHCRDYSR